MERAGVVEVLTEARKREEEIDNEVAANLRERKITKAAKAEGLWDGVARHQRHNATYHQSTSTSTTLTYRVGVQTSHQPFQYPCILTD